ncbi:MAG: N-acetylmuramoyl-L-alanine amidase [Alistipes sp.]|nr:N-acetylmuramoyl-L-alanine amidase [Alistipes sp.]
MRRSVFYLVAILFLALSSNAVFGENVAQGVRVVVIDAGHGGPKFPGARYNGICEKNINLQVALKLGALIERNMPDVKVVYTRKVEKQFSSVLTDDLQARADIANKADGDLFISIHSNAARDSRVRGVETLIMGESPMETRVNENILFANNKDEFLDMSDQKTAAIVRAYIQNLQFTYGEYSEMMARLVQKHYVKLGKVNRGVRKQPLKVLYATDMPSVLTEIGFMSNPQELKYITSEKGQNEIAAALFGAVKEYAEYVRKSLLVDSSSETSRPASGTVPQDSVAVRKAEAELAEKPQGIGGRTYSIQIMASADRLKTSDARFGAYRNKVKEYRAGGRFPYKYCVGEYADRAAAQAELKTVRQKFSTAFVVAVENGAIVTGK